MHAALALALISAPDREVVLWHSYRAQEAQAIDAAVVSYRAAHPDQVVRVLAVPFGAYGQKLRSAIPEGHGPDLFIAPHDFAGDLVRRGLIEPLPAPLQRERFLPATVEPLQDRDGRALAWPIAFKTLVLFYRTDLVAAPPTTTDELLALARPLTGGGRYGFAYPLGEFYFHAPWYFGCGARLFTPDETASDLASPEAAASGALLRAFALDEAVVPTDATPALVTELFNRGRAAMIVGGPWLTAEIEAGVPYHVAPLPYVSPCGRPAQPLSTVEGLFVAAGRARPSVFALAEAITSDEAARARALSAGQPVANAAVYADPAFAQNAMLKTMRAQLEHSVPMPKAALAQLVWEPLAEALRQIARGAKSPAAAFGEAQARVAVLNRDLPARQPPAPYLAALVVLLAALIIYAWRRAPPDLARQMYRGRVAYFFVLPTALGMLLLVGVPFLAGVGLGFFSFAPGEVRLVGFANFVQILTAQDYGLTHPLSFYFTLGVTMLWTVANVALHVALGFALALLLSSTTLAGRGFFRVVLILPWAVPNYITALIFKGLFNRQLGAVNALLAQLGVEPVGWFDSFWPAFTANLCTNVWLGFPFMMVATLGALQSVPQDLYDAARIDGAGAWTRFTRITLPQVMPALVPTVVLGTIWTFNMFNVVFLVSEGQPEGATDILVTEAYRWAFARGGHYGYAAAYSLVIFAILLAYSALTRRLLRLGERP